MRRFFCSLMAIMVTVVMVIGLVPAVDVRAEGMVDCGQMTIATSLSTSHAIMQDGSLWSWGSRF